MLWIHGVWVSTNSIIVSTNDVTIQGSTIVNQDDCIAINKGSNINFLNNHCTGGHGISVGSIASGSTVSTVRITGNTITNNVQALRIKTDANATSGSVSGVTYNGNTATGCTSYGVIIDQSYPDTLGSPGAGVKISGINFTGTNTITVASSAKGNVEVNCAKGGCTGVWDWAGLKVSGGPSGTILNADIINFKP
ncbi:endo-polygalacturonase [Rhizoctonia solani 123E]|uniref:endo-polygalacturonase n=1 Tax=Rhizoctonia solani 123E TaxID=1423351 RepID=A0A074RHQ1_9AGAM|nr:endo-polygalacturonase [Rhizoctonia solani 123E]